MELNILFSPLPLIDLGKQFLEQIKAQSPFGERKKSSGEFWSFPQNKYITSVEDPMDGSIGLDIFIVDNEISLGPDIASEAINNLLAKICGIVYHPVRTQYTYIEMESKTCLCIKIIVEGCSIAPFQVIQGVVELLVNDVKVTGIGPIVPEVYRLQSEGARVYEEKRVELKGPSRGDRNSISISIIITISNTNSNSKR